MLRVRISDDLEKEFRKAVALRYGYRQGVLAKAVEEAIKLWLGIEKEENVAEGEEKKNYVELKTMDLKEMLRAFVGEVPSVVAPHEKLGKIIVERGVIYVPLDKTKVTIGSELAKKICEECRCYFSISVLDDENYLTIHPKLGNGGFRNPSEEEEELRQWFMLEFKNIIEKIS